VSDQATSRFYLSAQWYSSGPKCGAVYVQSWSFHWALDGPVVYRDGRVQTLLERPRRTINVYNGLRTIAKIPLWPAWLSYCSHGFRRSAYWHRCDYVTVDNPKGRVPDRELYPEDYDENGVHWTDRTCFCHMKPEYSMCALHPDDDDAGVLGEPPA
jgi:NADH:ubiquinone oxidoreductase subunit